MQLLKRFKGSSFSLAMQLLTRFKEPSSYAAIAAALAVFAPNLVTGETMEYITKAGVGVAALIAFLMKEANSQN